MVSKAGLDVVVLVVLFAVSCNYSSTTDSFWLKPVVAAKRSTMQITGVLHGLSQRAASLARMSISCRLELLSLKSFSSLHKHFK